jgi:hypothetical protein
VNAAFRVFKNYFHVVLRKLIMAFRYPKDNDSYPFQAPDGKWLNSPSEAKKYSAKLDAKAAVKPVTTAKAATAPGKAARNDDGDVKLTSQFKDSSGRDVTYDFAGQAGTTAKPQEVLKTNLQTGPQLVNVDGKQTVVIPEGMQNNPGVPTAELQYDPALGQWTVPAGGANGFMTAHPQTPDFSPQLAFGLATLGLGAVTAPAVLANMGANAGGAAAGGVGAASGDALGLAQMGQAAGLQGSALESFVASGGTLGSTAAGGGGVGFGSLAGNSGGAGSPLGGSVTSTPTTPVNGAAQAIDGSAQTIYDAAANAGLPGYNTALTSGVAAGGAAGSTLGGAATAAGGASLLDGLKNFLPSGSDTSKLLGAALPAGLGYLGASSQADAMKDIYNQTRADRMPALNAYNSALQNPNTFYQSAPAMGAVDAVLRKLSVNGNPASNPGSLSQAAAYNLGGYNDYLRGLTPAAFGTANTEANIGMNQAGADAGKFNSIGYGLGQYFNPQPNLNDLLKNFSLNIGGVKA